MPSCLKVTTPEQMAAAIHIRLQVFFAEQGVSPLIDIDGSDERAVHFLLYDDVGKPVTTARYVMADGAAKIGRMATLASARGKGYGFILLQFILDDLRKTACKKAMLSSQAHATGFYEKAGFKMEGAQYIEADIPHVKMTCQL